MGRVDEDSMKYKDYPVGTTLYRDGQAMVRRYSEGWRYLFSDGTPGRTLGSTEVYSLDSHPYTVVYPKDGK
jgi:hypothetical protein